jgi:hypothetical protein
LWQRQGTKVWDLQDYLPPPRENKPAMPADLSRGCLDKEKMVALPGIEPGFED